MQKNCEKYIQKYSKFTDPTCSICKKIFQKYAKIYAKKFKKYAVYVRVCNVHNQDG